MTIHDQVRAAESLKDKLAADRVTIRGREQAMQDAKEVATENLRLVEFLRKALEDMNQ